MTRQEFVFIYEDGERSEDMQDFEKQIVEMAKVGKWEKQVTEYIAVERARFKVDLADGKITKEQAEIREEELKMAESQVKKVSAPWEELRRHLSV